MSAYIIEGGHPLDGSVRIHGAKNSVLPILAACLLAPGECVIHNCPELSDVAASLDILRHLGCRAERQGDAVVVDASAPTGWDVPDALMREMRSSVIFLGAILGRMGRAELCAPGGCELGPRPIDLHLGAIRGLGGRITEDGGGLRAEGALRGADLVLSLPSVGATENAMLAAVCAAGGRDGGGLPPPVHSERRAAFWPRASASSTTARSCPTWRPPWTSSGTWAAGRSGRGTPWWWTPPPPRAGTCPTR